MTENSHKEPGIVRGALTLFVITALAALALAFVYNSTKEKIQKTELKKKTDSFELIFPGHAFSEEKTENGEIFVEALNSKGDLKGYILFANGKGYSSTIRIAYGIDMEKKIQGMTIIFQQETPGLGARAEEVKTDVTLFSFLKNILSKKEEAVVKEQPKPWFQKQYTGLLLDELWLKAEKESGKITAITGATITSNAITKAIRESLDSFIKNHKFPEQK